MNLHGPQAGFLAGLFLYLAIRAVYQRRARGRTPTVDRSNGLDRLLILLVILGQIALPLLYVFSSWLDFANHESPPITLWLGGAVWIAGLWMFWRSHADLGSNWSVTLELQGDHRLVTQGVYRRVRHPMYSALLVLGIAQAIVLPNWLAGSAGLAAIMLLCIVRIPKEESMMCDHFGPDYREYMKRTGHVIPGIGRA